MYAKRIAAIVAAVSVAAALAVGVTPQPAQAAASVSIGSVTKTNAADIKSKGTIKTPTVKTFGNVAVSSRSYVITKGKKTVAKTSIQGKTYKLGVGTYKVRSKVKYRTVTTKALSGGHWDANQMWEGSVKDCRITKYTEKWFTPDGRNDQFGHWSITARTECRMDNGDLWRGSRSAAGNAKADYDYVVDNYPINEWSVELAAGPVMSAGIEEKWVPNSTKVYGPWKTVTKTQTVKISRIKPPYSWKTKCTMTLAEYKRVQHNMTVEQVRKIAGCKGQVDSYSVSEDSEGVKGVDLVLMFSKDNKMPIMGGITTWIQFHNGKVWVKDYCDQHRQYSKTWN